MFEFSIAATSGKARAAIFHTPHGKVPTPVFAPVGTQAAVKALTPGQVQEVGCTLVLANTYHLHLRPGDDVVRDLGGLHAFMGWHQPLLTDSGGFQVFSLAQSREVDEEGVTFRSHLDGSQRRLTPEISIRIQENLGADIIMAFDECSDPNDSGYSAAAMQRTHRWAERCMRAKTRTDQALFGIVQGGVSPDLRIKSAEFISALGTPGIAIGGLSVGETKAEMHTILDVLMEALPADRPKYLMGVGTPEDLIDGIARGVDIFDCVLPTRLARHHAAFSQDGRLNMMNARFTRDERPIDSNCDCYACRSFSRAYIRHLINSGELLAGVLLSIHNLRCLIRLVADVRTAILDGTFEDRLPAWREAWQGNASRAGSHALAES